MDTIDDFIALLDQELGITVSAEDAGERLDRLPSWDSLHLLTLLSALERRTGRPVSLPDAVRAATLRDLYELTVA
ncbi:hypothetical protein BZB76_6438 [Actinomadura pelletieri DSM 43383]|uniref:Carrier domain-containing protein n=1 Tax=Actinomadura pelletieri DSM 43383 TaxID=1120940 RepID=A0A495Q9M5_9ACTN|nr:acyl carrier protein [Actinomadura pelletieri]RKS68190.1 hypothetical protein BZB76_6438 [Actinomadura pelletieri DSM 43383]